jgi:hypothetical protein
MLLLLLGGCTVLGVAAYKFAGPPPVEAQYTPAKVPMLVLVENYQRQSSGRANADLLARYVSDQLSDHDVAPIIPPQELDDLRTSHPDFSTMSMSAIGKALAAEQVLYVQMIRDDVAPLVGGESLQGEMRMRVKIVDVASGETLWPTDLSDGHEIALSTQLGSDAGGRTAREVQQRLDASLADEIAKLFYKWKPEK